MDKSNFEIWAIDVSGNTIADFETMTAAEEWSLENNFFQILYRANVKSPIFVYK